MRGLLYATLDKYLTRKSSEKLAVTMKKKILSHISNETDRYWNSPCVFVIIPTAPIDVVHCRYHGMYIVRVKYEQQIRKKHFKIFASVGRPVFTWQNT